MLRRAAAPVAGVRTAHRSVLLGERLRAVSTDDRDAARDHHRRERRRNRDWKPYEFRWKPGDLARPPRFNTPHQPRLDWQMWFEALRGNKSTTSPARSIRATSSPWFQSLLMKLAEGRTAGRRPAGRRSVPDAPPKFVRIMLYQYRFTIRRAQKRRATGGTASWSGPAPPGRCGNEWSQRDSAPLASSPAPQCSDHLAA